MISTKSIRNTFVVPLLFIISGICGMTYEVAWSKYLSTFIGSSGYAHTIVLATYMAGLALGAFFWGNYCDKTKNHLRLYGLLESGIGLYCLAYPVIIETAGTLFAQTATEINEINNQSGKLALKFILSFLTLIIPTFFMGGTIPILAKFFTKSINNSGKEVAVLYYLNSLGAVVGTGLAGFILIRNIGIEHTVTFAALANLLIAIIALFISRRTKDLANKTAPITEESANQTYPKTAVRLAIYTAAFSGFIAMLYELAWIRMLSNILGSTTYSFTLMLIAFISGITIGSFIVSLIIKKIKNLLFFLGICQYGTAVSMILMLPVYERLPYFLVKLSEQMPNVPEKFPMFLSFQFLFCFLIMIVPTIFSGMALPIASRLANNNIKFVGKSTGSIFSINTLGSVVGTLMTGLILIPWLGTKATFETGVFLNGILSLIIFYHLKISKQFKMGFAISFMIIAIGYKVFVPDWNQNFLISGVFRTLNSEKPLSYSELKRMQNDGQKILWHKEGINANVAIRESKFGDVLQKTLVINGKADASSVADLNTQILLAQLPLMLTPNTGDALVIGLGSGITCGSALSHPIKSLDVVEIASEVVECNHFFNTENNNFIKDPRTTIYIDDAITKLKTSKKKYDYIISEPSNPWIAGIGNLFSVEFFDTCKKQLKPHGVMTQWFHNYEANNEIFNLIMSTICHVFPNVSIWKVSDADILILASANPIKIDFDAVDRKLNTPEIAKDLARIKMYDVPTLLSTQIVSARNNPFAYQQNRVNSTDKPVLEYMAPVALFTHQTVTVLDSLDERFTFMDKNLWISEYEKQKPLLVNNLLNIARYRSESRTGDLAIAYTALRKAIFMQPDNLEAQQLLRTTSEMMQIPDATIRESQLNEMRMMYEQNPNDISGIFAYLNSLIQHYRLENSIIHQQQMEEAVELLRSAIETTHGNEEQLRFILGMVLTGAGRNLEAAKAFEDLAQFQKQNGSTISQISTNDLIFNIGESYYHAGKTKEAESYFTLIKSTDSDTERASKMVEKINLKKAGRP